MLLAIFNCYYGNKKHNQWRLIAIIFLVLSALGHILIFFVMGFFIIILFARELFVVRNFDKIKKTLPLLFVFFGLISSLFFINQDIFQRLIGHIQKYSAGRSESLGSQATGSIVSLISKISLPDFLIYIGLEFGRFLIPLVVIMAAWLVFRKKNSEMKKFNKMMWVFIALASFDLFFFVNPFFVHTIPRITSLSTIFIAQIPLLSIALYWAFLKNKKHVYKSYVMYVVLMTSLFSLTLYGACASPSTFTVNKALTHNEVAGMNWIFTNQGADTLVGSVHNPQNAYRFRDFFYGPWKDHSDGDIDIISYNIIPEHFANGKSSLYDRGKFYLTIMGYDEHVHDVVTEKIGEASFTPSDFVRFRGDPKIFKIYDSMNIEGYWKC